MYTTGSQTLVFVLLIRRRLRSEKMPYLRFLNLVFSLLDTLFLLADKYKQGVLLHGEAVVLPRITLYNFLCSPRPNTPLEQKAWVENETAKSFPEKLAPPAVRAGQRLVTRWAGDGFLWSRLSFLCDDSRRARHLQTAEGVCVNRQRAPNGWSPLHFR